MRKWLQRQRWKWRGVCNPGFFKCPETKRARDEETVDDRDLLFETEQVFQKEGAGSR